MTPRPTGRRRKAEPAPFAESGLTELGVAPGDQVRFRRHDGERWKNATVARREKDGSVGLHDARGAARSIAIELIEVRDRGPRGGVVWEPLAARAARTEQLALVRPPEARRRSPGRRPTAADEPDASVDGSGDDAALDDQAVTDEPVVDRDAPDEPHQLRLL